MMFVIPVSSWPKAILFDLDGTLIDSAPDIAEAVNTLLVKNGLPPCSVTAVRGMIGDGVGKLVERAFLASGKVLDPSALDLMTNEMMSIYAYHLTNQTIYLPGAFEVVVAYRKADIKVAVVSNKPKHFTDEILDHYGFLPHLSATQGAEEGLSKKPAPDMLLAVLKKIGLKPEEALFVGDSKADVGAARAAGMPVVLVRGGYSLEKLESLGADAICDSLKVLPETIAGLALHQ